MSWEENHNLCVPWYLMSSYLYYHRPDLAAILTDDDYDRLCRVFRDNWTNIKHRHKSLVRLKHLTAGTGYYIPEHKYPAMVRHAAMMLSERGPVLRETVEVSSDLLN